MPRLLQELVRDRAEKHPEKAFVVLGETRLTYAQVDALSSRLARLLMELGCERGDRVALLSPKSPIALVGLLGIYKADCIYVPLDPASPARRIRKIVDSCAARWILAAGAVTGLLRELIDWPFAPALSIGWLEAVRPAADEELPIAFTLGDLDT